MSYQFFAGSGFSQDQNGGVRWRYSLHFNQDRFQSGTGTYNSFERSLVLGPFIRSNSVHLVYERDFYSSISGIPPLLKMTMIPLWTRDRKSSGRHLNPPPKTTMEWRLRL